MSRLAAVRVIYHSKCSKYASGCDITRCCELSAISKSFQNCESFCLCSIALLK